MCQSLSNVYQWDNTIRVKESLSVLNQSAALRNKININLKSLKTFWIHCILQIMFPNVESYPSKHLQPSICLGFVTCVFKVQHCPLVSPVCMDYNSNTKPLLPSQSGSVRVQYCCVAVLLTGRAIGEIQTVQHGVRQWGVCRVRSVSAGNLF